MRILVWNHPPELAKPVTAVARMLAEHLGDSTHLLAPRHDAEFAEGVAGGVRARVHEGAAGGHECTSRRNGGAKVIEAESPDVTDALAECIDLTAAADRVRLVVAPWSGDSESAVWPRENPAEEIAFRAPVPTLVIRDAAPLLAWADGLRPLRVLVAHDLTRTADDALTLIRQLTEIGPCEIVVAHVHRPVEAIARMGLKPHPARDGEREVREILQRDLADRVHRVLDGARAEIRVRPTSSRHDNAVLELLRRECFDLVVAGTHQRHGVDRLAHPVSLSRGLLRSAGTNVLLVPATRTLPQPLRGGIARVLVATDLSWSSNQAVPHGYALLPRGGTLRLLHVVHPRALPNGEFDQGISRRASRDRHLEVLHESRAQLQALALGEADAPGVDTEFELVEHTQPAVAIAQAAERFGADVVCLAAHPADGVFGRLFKTQIQAVMAKTNRTLLIVHPSSP